MQPSLKLLPEHRQVIYYRRYVGDYARDTAHLSLMEHGVYSLLLDTQYGTGKALPVELPALCRIARSSSDEERAAVQSIADQFFPVVDGGRWNPRAKRELAIGLPAIEKMREGGRIGALKRWGGDREPHGDAHSDGVSDGVGHGEGDGVIYRVAIHPPTTNQLQEKKFKSLPLATLVATGKNSAVLKDKDTSSYYGSDIPPGGVTVPCWLAYSDAYRARYQVEPVRNRQVNAQLAQLVSRLGIEAAPAVAAFYVAHDFQLYVRNKHPVNLLLRDAEGLHTEWRRGMTVTSSEAMQADKTSGTGNVFRRLIAELPEERTALAAKGGEDEPY